MKTFPKSQQSIVGSFSSYLKNNLKFDLVSGVVVALIAIPLSIAFAVGSGARPEQGLYTAIIGGILMGALSGSKFQVCGPAGAFIVVLSAIVSKFGLDGLMIAGLMAGVILTLMGIFKLGTVIKFIPYPVTIGFTSGIGTIIFFTQIKDFLGLDFPRPENFIENLEKIAHGVSQGVNITSIIIGASTIAAFIIWKKLIHKSFPPAPFAFIVGTIVSLVIGNFFKDALPAPILIGQIPTGLPAFQMPDLSLAKLQMMLPSAITIALLGAIESLLSAVVADGMTGTKHNSNRELISQGVGNIVMPFFGAIPATGVITRTAVNIKNGAKTRGSTIIHGITLLLVLLIFAPWAQYIPKAALAGILLMISYNMAELPHLFKISKGPKQDAIVLLATFILTVFTDLTIGVGTGVLLAVILFIKNASDVKTSVQEFDANKTEEGHINYTSAKYKNVVFYEITGQLFFGAAAELENRMIYNEGDNLVLNLKRLSNIDVSAIHTLEVIVSDVKKKGGKVFLCGANEIVRKKMHQAHLTEKLDKDSMCDTVKEALDKVNKKSK